MALPHDSRLCNGTPIDHRLRPLLSNAKQKHSYGVGKHSDIIETFGNNLVRDNGTTPTKHEKGFAAWLAKPDMTGGLVIALQQPAKSQVFTEDFEWVRDECNTLAYLDKSLAFINGPGGLKTTSVFDAFPFITEEISQSGLSNEATIAHNTFLSMVEAKKPEVLFACWRIHGQETLSFSGKGPGRTNEVHSLRFPNGHVVRVVNGFHPSYVANYCPNESCFRKLFALELCKALCELNAAWQEKDWMKDLRRICRERTIQLMKEKGRDGEQLNTETGRELRRTKADNTTKKYNAYTKSFDNGLKSVKQIFNHMMSSTYSSQSSRELYRFLVYIENASEGICDALLAVSEAMSQYDMSNPDSKLVELGKHISQQTLVFVRDAIPDLVQHQRGLFKNPWSDRYSASLSRGLKQSLENITVQFIGDLQNSFSEEPTGWTYTPKRVYDAFKELAVSLEDALGREYDDLQRRGATDIAHGVDNLSASLNTLSLFDSKSDGSITKGRSTVSTRSSSNDDCFNCGQPGHWTSDCRNPKKGSTSSTAHSRSSSITSCYNCDRMGHWTSNCPSPKKGPLTPPKSSASSSSGNCYTCGQPGHWSGSCPSTKSGTPGTPPRTPSKTPSSGSCFHCGKTGHWSNNCSLRALGNATPSRSTSGDKCYRCGKMGHWSNNCPAR